MKKLSALALVFVCFAAFSAAAFAEEAKGVVESIDAGKHEIVIKDSASGASKTVVVHPKVIATLRAGSVVKASLKSGSDVAETISVEVG